MTREEAIRVLKYGTAKAETKYKAIDMAIQALSAESCEDAISRQAAMAAIRSQYPGIPFVDVNGARRKWAEKYAQYRECEKIIESLPPVNSTSNVSIQITEREKYGRFN